MIRMLRGLSILQRDDDTVTIRFRIGRFLAGAVILIMGLIIESAAPALAAEQIKLSVGGKMEQYFFIMDADQLPGENLNSTGALSDVEVYFSGKAVLDNGVEISVKMELEAEHKTGRDADEQWLEIKSAFGKLRIGETEGFNHNYTYEGPYVAYEDDEIIGRVVPRRIAIGAKEVLTFERFTGTAFQVGYETPTVAGFTIGANYFPTTTQGEDGFFDKATIDNNAWEVSGAWEGDMGGRTLGIAAGYFNSQSRVAGNDGEQAWNISAEVEAGGFTVGGAYIRSTPEDNLDSTAFSLGATYEIGPLGLGASYFRIRANATPNALVQDRLDQGKIEASYILVRGIKLGVTGFWAGQEPAGGPDFNDIGLISSAILRF